MLEYIVKPEWADRLQLSPDDYLQGVIGASNELVCFPPPLVHSVHLADQSDSSFAHTRARQGPTRDECRHAPQLFAPPAHRRVRKGPLCRLLARTFSPAQPHPSMLLAHGFVCARSGS